MNKKLMIEGLVLVAAMLSVVSTASAKTYYCVAYAYSHDEPTVAKVFSVSADEWHNSPCSTGCQNDWHDYVKANYEGYYKMDPDVLGPYESRSKAMHDYNDLKYRARNKWHQPFHNASDFPGCDPE